MARWLSEQAVRVFHAELLAEHGGLPGPPKEGCLEAVLERPKNRVAYGTASLAKLAACYGVAIARGHCFPDGNKRLALAVMDVFLQINERELTAAEADAVLTIQEVAAGNLDETNLNRWVEANMAVR